MNIRTRVKSNGDLIIEKTTLEHAGEFRVETARDKLTFPLKINGNNFDPTTVQELYFANTIAQVSGSTVYISFSGSLASGSLSDISVSGTIATDIRNLNEDVANITSSILLLSSSCKSSDDNLSSSIGNLSSSFSLDLTTLSSSCQSSDSYLSSTITVLNDRLTSVSQSISHDIIDLSNSIFALSGSVTSSFNYTYELITTLSSSYQSSDDVLSSSIEILSGSVSASFAQLRHNQLNNLLSDDHTQYLHISGTRAMKGPLLMAENYISGAKYIDFEIDPGTLSYKEGRLHYDPADRTLTLMGRSANSSLQIGQEQLLFCVNKTTGTIWNGATVFVSGSQGLRPQIDLADADYSEDSCKLIGLATEDIAENESGYVLINGLAHDVNTLPWPVNTQVYLSTKAGELTDTPPTGSARVMLVGQIIVQHQNQGMIAVGVRGPEHLEHLHDVFEGVPYSGSFLCGRDSQYWETKNFASESQYVAFNDRWDDLQGNFDSSTGATTNLTLDVIDSTGFQRLYMRHDQDNYFSMTWQMPHGWNRKTVRPHIHFLFSAQPGLNTTGTIELGYAHAWLFGGVTLSSWTSGSLQIQVSGSMFNTTKIVGFGDVVPPVGAGNSAMLLLRCMRSGTASSDTYTTSKTVGVAQCNLGVLYCDTHYQRSCAGSVTELV